MVFVAVAVFVVVVAVALVLLMSTAIGAFSAMFSEMRADSARRRARRGDSPVSTAGPVASNSADPLGELADDMRLAQARRWASCRSVQSRLPDQTNETSGYVARALDIWGGGDLDRLRGDRVGQIVWTTAMVADSVARHPAWKLDFFDRHAVRVDLDGEVASIATAAAGLRDQLDILGDSPKGHLGVDDEVIATFTEKSRVLSGRLDGLVARVEAFADYEQIVARIQQRQEKQAWLDRVSAIDEFEHVVDAEWDRAESDRVRNMAGESEVLASIYLDEIAPLAKSLKRSDAA